MQKQDVHLHDKRRSFWDRIWKDQSGKVVIWQTPNVWLIAWAVFTCLSLFFIGGAGDVSSWIASGSLVVWSILEVLMGADYFRRALGLVVLLYAVATVIKSL
jgi:hypothetical protein